ncbi:DUF3572 domain-containing protein [Telmatospirillum sp. J64-1]|uniref:DUF3572 domain-containing protein n=1 Tax=Telmatospirillum sp. J64-1 TaxID=2502183 RepID=UPI00115D2D63|nr:DUF3572 domain-containing protein [Telmatospirillum sp. J64-1]
MPPQPRSEQAEAIALHALAYILSDEDLLTRFLALTGCDGDSLRRNASDPAFLGAVLDFVLEDDRHVVAVAQAAEINPEMVIVARSALPGAANSW